MNPTSTRAEPDGTPVADVRTLRHGFSLAGASALSLAVIRPLGSFTNVPLMIAAAGLAGWLAVLVMLVVMLVVTAVFGALASRWPLEGSVTAWSRQLLGARAGLMTGWLYLCTYVLYMGLLSYFDAQRLLFLVGVSAPTWLQGASAALLVVVVATLVNGLGRRVLTYLLIVCVAISVIACAVYATLLLGHAQRGFFDLFQTPTGGSLDWNWLAGPFLIGLAWATANTLRGFELPADVAEEIREPRVNVRRAMGWPLLVGGALVLYAMIALALAVPAASTVSTSMTQNPYAASIGTVMQSALGEGSARPFAALQIIATFGAIAVCQLAASRTLWTMARDREVPGHRWLVGLNSRDRIPMRALTVIGIATFVLILIAPDFTAFVLGGASGLAFLLAFMVTLVGLLVALRRGTWQTGSWSTGRWLGPVTVVAVIVLAALAVNLGWPREVLFGAGFEAWRPLILLVVIIGAGLILMAWAFRDGGIHVRNLGHVDRDLHERILLAHTGTCSVCHRGLAHGEEVFWNPEAHVTICVTCDEDVVV